MSDLFISWLPPKKIPYLPILFAPPQAVETFSAKTSRRISKTESARADTLREINSDVIRAKLVRKVANTEKVSADTFTQIFALEKFSADTKIQLGIKEKIHGDTFLQVALSQKVQSDLNRALPEFSHADALRKIVRVEKTPADTIIRVPHVLNYVVTPRLLSKKKLSAAESPSLVNTFKDYGVTSINITLNEKTLSDDFRLETCRQMEINDAVQGSLLDYHFNFLVEETEQTELVQTVKGRYNQDDLLYTWFNLTSDNQNPYPKAQEIITRIANYFGLASDVRIDDFAPDNLSYDTTITYSDLLNSVFGWTSRVPQRQINIFIRGGILHCIQRGKEISVFDITDLPHSRPTINKKFNRVLCHNPNNDNDDNDDNDNEYKFSGTISYSDNGIAPFQAQIYVAYTYENGLLVKEQYSTNTGLFADEEGKPKTISNYSSTSYFYTTFEDRNSDENSDFEDKISDENPTLKVKNSDEKIYYISSKENTTKTVEQIWQLELYRGVKENNVTSQITSTSYYYKYNEKSVYLFHEHEQTNSSEVLDGEETTERSWSDTYHVPVGNGWYAQTLYRNGIFQGANLSQGKPGNAVSPYTIKQTQENFKGFDINYIKKKETLEKEVSPLEELSFIVDDSFPVRESEMKKNLNDALRWLHRKIEEIISLDLISSVENGIPKINHIVDFTERIRFNGNDYFLISNHISFTPRKFIQKLQLVRWY